MIIIMQNRVWSKQANTQGGGNRVFIRNIYIVGKEAGQFHIFSALGPFTQFSCVISN